MKLLLDTPVLLWWAGGDRRLSSSTRDLIASGEHEVVVSAASFWEIAIKRSLGRIDIKLEELLATAEADGFADLPVRAAHTLHLAALPPLHSDPFDRLLIAQAIAETARLVTRDDSILQYTSVEGFLSLRV
ncbi:MAG TPA: type II toxin-antitoxin system VapC family toxin [Thermoanaerobaculia bacterium]